ncbi:hypothetical protein C8Q73DRAFT_795226 [Cubamyces lactineus]|nr:hypothetical protein C8Q73DRAFT_795226 [Cubamyces lactineus]
MSTVSAKSQYHLRPVSTIHPRDASPATSSSTTSDRSPPLSAHHAQSKAFLPPASATFSPIPTSARPRRPLSPTSLRDVDPPLDPERAFAARGKFPAPPTGHELMALFPPAPPPIRPGPTSGYFQREERQFFAQAGKEIVRVRIEIETPTAMHSHPHPLPNPHPHVQQQQQPPPLPPPPAAPLTGPATGSPTHTLPQPPQHRHPHQHPHAHPHPHQHRHERGHSGPSPSLPPPPPPPPPHSTSPRMHMPPGPGYPMGSPQGPPTLGGPGGPAHPVHPGYPIHSPTDSSRAMEVERGPPGRGVGGGGPGDAMVVEDDDEAWRHPTPHNARRRAGKHTRRVIVK